MIIIEIHDLLRLWGYAAWMVHHARGFDDPAPCPQRCLMCDTCSKAYEWAVDGLTAEDETVFLVQNEGGVELGIICFTGSTLHAFFFDGKLWGRQVPIAEACQRMRLRGIEPVARMPVTEHVLVWWLRRNGWTLQPYNGDAVFINNQLVPMVNLSCPSS